MSHHPGCPKNQSTYADCTCASIELREHTEALNRNSSVVSSRIEELEAENAQLRETNTFLQRLSDEEGNGRERANTQLAAVSKRHDFLVKSLQYFGKRTCSNSERDVEGGWMAHLSIDVPLKRFVLDGTLLAIDAAISRSQPEDQPKG